MGLGGYLVGLLLFIGTWGAAAATAAVLVQRRLPRLGGVPRVLAWVLIGLAALMAAHLVPGVLGILSRWSALAFALAGLAAASRFVTRAAGAPHDDTPAALGDSGPVSWAVAALAVALIAVDQVAQMWLSSGSPPVEIDTLTFQLPEIGRWIQTGSLWHLNEFAPLQAHTNYPHDGDLVYLAAVEPFRSDFLVRLVGPPCVAIAGLAAYALGRELRAPRATAVLGGALFAALPAVAAPANVGAKPDAVMLAAFGAGALFLVRHLRVGRTADLVLAGLGLGLAFGSKWYGVPAALVLMAVWAAARSMQGAGARAVLRGTVVLAGMIAVCGGFWLVRNAIQSGSPTFPVGLGPFWKTPPDFYRDCVGFPLVHYAGDAAVLRDYVWPGLRQAFGLGGAILGLAWLAAAIAGAREGGSERAAVRALVAGAALIGLVYVVTPYTALGIEGRPTVIAGNARYLAPALLIAAALVAWVAGRLSRARILAEVFMLAGVIDGARRAFDVSLRYEGAASLALLVLAGVTYGIYGARRSRPAIAGVACVALVLAAVGYARQRTFDDGRYAAGSDPVVRYLATHDRSGTRVGLAGTPAVDGLAPVWPAFGLRIDARVSFVGHTVDGQLREYDDQRAWRIAIARGRYDLLVVGRGGYAHGCGLPGQRGDDDAWARTAGFPILAQTPRLTLYKILPPS